MSCLGGAHFTLSPGARGNVGDTHSWTLNNNDPVPLSRNLAFGATMHFETLDQGASRGRERYRVSTRGYMYAMLNPDGQELFAAHWHPSSRSSSYTGPHYHLGGMALAETGVFMSRAHIASPRVSFEGFIRMMIEQFGIEATCADWKDRLKRTEKQFEDHRSWG